MIGSLQRSEIERLDDVDPSQQMIQARTGRLGEKGASLVEYALLLALIAVVCIGAVGALGGATSEPYSNLADSGLG